MGRTREHQRQRPQEPGWPIPQVREPPASPSHRRPPNATVSSRHHPRQLILWAEHSLPSPLPVTGILPAATTACQLLPRLCPLSEMQKLLSGGGGQSGWAGSLTCGSPQHLLFLESALMAVARGKGTNHTTSAGLLSSGDVALHPNSLAPCRVPV